MRILLINTIGKGASTGRTVTEMQSRFHSKGNVCEIAYASGCGAAGSFYFGNKVEHAVHLLISRTAGLEGYASWHSTKKLIDHISEFKPDIVHIFVMHSHIVNLRALFFFLSENKIPVVLNLDDYWWFTGKCTYFHRHHCDKYKNICYECPAKHDSPDSLFFDFSKKMQRDKAGYFAKLPALETICVSKYSKARADESSVLGKYQNNFVYNWVDANVFKPTRIETSLGSRKKRILCVSSKWISGSEKYSYLLQLADHLMPETELVVAGEIDKSFSRENVTLLGCINDPQKLAELYSSADVYVHLSTYETFGKVVAEAMACGTPSVVFQTTALAELVDESVGYAVSDISIQGVIRGIEVCLAKGKGSYSTNCMRRAADLFDMNTNIDKIYKVYTNCINKARKGI